MSSPVEPVEIVVISLVRSTERRLAATRQLEATGLPWSFVVAVDAATFPPFPPEFDHRQHIRYYGFPIPVGQIGCFLSHRLAWEKCVAADRLTLILKTISSCWKNCPASLRWRSSMQRASIFCGCKA